MATYAEINEKQPVLVDCFFAFSHQQYNEGIERMQLQNKTIINVGNGLYGTKEGIEKVYEFYEVNTKEIADNCEPQDVYDYEHNNHECSYTKNDTEAITHVYHIFGMERTQTVKRKHKCFTLEYLFPEDSIEEDYIKDLEF
jgi:hypothetical protein